MNSLTFECQLQMLLFQTSHCSPKTNLSLKASDKQQNLDMIILEDYLRGKKSRHSSLSHLHYIHHKWLFLPLGIESNRISIPLSKVSGGLRIIWKCGLQKRTTLLSWYLGYLYPLLWYFNFTKETYAWWVCTQNLCLVVISKVGHWYLIY